MLHKNNHAHFINYQTNTTFAICKTGQSKIDDEFIHETLNICHIIFDVDLINRYKYQKRMIFEI